MVRKVVVKKAKLNRTGSVGSSLAEKSTGSPSTSSAERTPSPAEKTTTSNLSRSMSTADTVVESTPSTLSRGTSFANDQLLRCSTGDQDSFAARLEAAASPQKPEELVRKAMELLKLADKMRHEAVTIESDGENSPQNEDPSLVMESWWRVEEEEEERIRKKAKEEWDQAEKKAKEQRIQAEKKAIEEKEQDEKKKEEERIRAEQKKAEEQRIQAEKKADEKKGKDEQVPKKNGEGPKTREELLALAQDLLKQAEKLKTDLPKEEEEDQDTKKDDNLPKEGEDQDTKKEDKPLEEKTEEELREAAKQLQVEKQRLAARARYMRYYRNIRRLKLIKVFEIQVSIRKRNVTP